MTVNKPREIIFEIYYKRIGFLKKRIYYSICFRRKDFLLLRTKSIEKISHPPNAK